ncbi:hypothetical protein CC78DRAFT_387605 [Lojkania enalia]|uniref:Uncharacterized protein n=1 Tax=Lojkania enalia TaxID=147567 RepID=A0A9P4MWZ8_9PLEO|nr:hypothetical protein CC78DRAFT_387605 [Didymosphaeria enalia]
MAMAVCATCPDQRSPKCPLAATPGRQTPTPHAPPSRSANASQTPPTPFKWTQTYATAIRSRSKALDLPLIYPTEPQYP